MTCSFRPVFAARGTAIRVTRGASAVRLVTAALLAAGGVAAGVLPVTVLGSARADEVTISTDNMRDGWDRGETSASLTPATLQSGTFGAVFTAQVDGQVYAQPFVAGNTLIVATENDSVYGLNKVTGAVKWRSSQGTPWPDTPYPSTNLTPTPDPTN